MLYVKLRERLENTRGEPLANPKEQILDLVQNDQIAGSGIQAGPFPMLHKAVTNVKEFSTNPLR